MPQSTCWSRCSVHRRRATFRHGTPRRWRAPHWRLCSTGGGPPCSARSAPDAARQEFAGALETMLAPVAAGPTCFVHRDFFAGNLIWLPQRAGIRRIGVLDFQSAAIGHPAYDLASLLQDARRDIPAAVAEAAIERYLAARPELHPAEFRAAYAACAAQRHLRVAGQWVRLARRDGRPGYLGMARALGDCWIERCATPPQLRSPPRWIAGSRRTDAATRRASRMTIGPPPRCCWPPASAPACAR